MVIDNHPYKILIVEDNSGDYLLASDYIHDIIINAELSHAKDFKEAQNFLNNKSNTFDVVLLDLSLPDIDKEALFVETQSFCQNLPIIVLTGFSDTDLAIRSLTMGFSDYLIKDHITSTVLYKSIVYSIERFRIFRSLKVLNQRYMDLFHLSPIPMWVYDLETLTFLNVNKAAVKHYGYAKDEFLTMTLKDIRPEEDHEIFMQTILNNKKQAANYFGNTYRHLKKNGELIYVEIRGNVIDFEGRKAEIVLATDITEKLDYIKAVENQNIRLKDIAWTQSHVVRAPLSRLMAIIDLVKNGDLDVAEKEELLGHVLESANEIDDIIRDISEKTKPLI
ncbi:PAS domain S-box protein [Mariniflexile sp. AS56]|uniref:PAS domain S-box protein n=1 Tax=Mariniflexile sp. AS56 TaxID=3063957 RepID=UPI0026EF384C|nr:PAS domain S-box protein [Mariniflexile sp. AS56]MDO7173268.1 PAS domain S-box protein [Mariniflexile sp. AS56]